ncbi:Protein of unknown function DUF4582 family-containing protein [Strongyloides ratti]|uniref:Uncharacterized protein n=1 Tax=Strongyloides ratti TaxID=34506 RepID=A0A090LFF8_STRRB|nr:Protein of unknown function DUF4582 family-containing protein [Strongyloides ratti]CEF66195.1 Protein of unknown function DUF4582 family-containing protein [Strongyloides ratti]
MINFCLSSNSFKLLEMAITCFDMSNISNEVGHTSIWDPHLPNDVKNEQFDELNSQEKGNDFQGVPSFDNNLYQLSSSCWVPQFNSENGGCSKDKMAFHETFSNESDLNNLNQNNSIFLEPLNGWNSWNNIYNWIDKHDNDIPSTTNSPAVPDQGSNCSEEHSDSMRSDSFTTSPLRHSSPINSTWTRNFDDSNGSNYYINNAKGCNNKYFSNILTKMGNLQVNENFSLSNWQDSMNDINNTQQPIDIPSTPSPTTNIWQNYDPSNNRDDGYYFPSSLSDLADTNKEMNNIWHINTPFNSYAKTSALNQIQNRPLPQNNMEKVKEMYTRNEEKSQECQFIPSQNNNNNNNNNNDNNSKHQQWGNDRCWNSMYSQYQNDKKESYEMLKNHPRQNNTQISSKPILPNNQIGATYSMYQNTNRTKSSSPIYSANKKLHQSNAFNNVPLSRAVPNSHLAYVCPPNITRDGKLNCDEEELDRYHKTLQMHQLAYDQIYDVVFRNNGPVIENNILPENYHYPPTEYFRPVYPIITSKNCDRGQMYPTNGVSNIVNFCQQVNNYKRENDTVYLKIEECSSQYRQLENERKKTEAELARHNLGKKISSSNTIQIPRLPPAPLKIDRLIVDYFREHARVTTLLSKMIQLREKPMPPIVHEVMAEFLGAIKNLQKMRLQERENILSYLRGEVGSYNERIESMNLTRALVDVIRTTQKARAANWCCLIWTLGPLDNEQEIQIEKIIQANFQVDPPEIKFRPV